MRSEPRLRLSRSVPLGPHARRFEWVDDGASRSVTDAEASVLVLIEVRDELARLGASVDELATTVRLLDSDDGFTVEVSEGGRRRG